MSAEPHARSLQDLIDSTPDLVDYLYNDSPGAHARGRADLTPVRQEFTNWRDEQRSWRESAILFDQSHHMPELIVKGPDAKKLLNWVGLNSLANLAPGRAKQFMAVNEDGYMIGDCILYALEDETYELVSSMPLLNWVEYQIVTGDWDVTYTRDHNTSDNPSGTRERFRYQLDGPNAGAIFDEVVDGGVAPEIGPFRTARASIAGVEVMVLRHSMSGHRGYEISGPYDKGESVVLAAILEAGKRHGLLQAGATTYFSASFEGGWMAYPLPAVYTSPSLAEYRKWLPADSWEGRFQLAGSFRPERIDDYYVTPYDMGYGKLVSFDHDFIGRAALEKIAEQHHRTKVTLHWNKEDILKVMGSMFEDGELPYKYIQLPVADYGNLTHRDEVYNASGEVIGVVTKVGYTVNERRLISLGMVDLDKAAVGDEVEILWGEPDGGSRKPRVERHRQTRVRATIVAAH